MYDALEDPNCSSYKLIDSQPGTNQEWLTDRLIRPNIEAIGYLFVNIRRACDEALSEEKCEIRGEYPIGRCGEIRDNTIKKLAELMADPSMESFPGVQFLKSFHAHGGKIKRFWAIDSGRYFQNAIQIGSIIFDVANDTVESQKPSVVAYLDIDLCPMKNITDFCEMAEVIESYWGWKVYVNDVYPVLAPLYPFLVYRPETDEYFFHEDTDMVAFNAFHTGDIEPVTASSKKFIFDSKFSSQRLPDEVKAVLQQTSHPYNQCIAATINREALTKTLERAFEQTAANPDTTLPLLQELHRDCGLGKSLLSKGAVDHTT